MERRVLLFVREQLFIGNDREADQGDSDCENDEQFNHGARRHARKP
jgi:hypothetical protein